MMELFYVVIGILEIILLYQEEKTVNIEFGINTVDNFTILFPMIM